MFYPTQQADKLFRMFSEQICRWLVKRFRFETPHNTATPHGRRPGSYNIDTTVANDGCLVPRDSGFFDEDSNTERVRFFGPKRIAAIDAEKERRHTQTIQDV